MSVLNTVRDLQNETAWQASIDAKKMREDSVNNRNTGGMMGKHDFLKLLAAQLQHQDPLNPQNDSDFAASLAQFSSLEQMQNMNETLAQMSSYQSYSLIGKYVIAEAMIDGVWSELPGIVDSIFMNNGVTFAQIGEYIVPISAIKEVFNTDNVLTSEMLLEASKNLIGRTIVGHADGKEVEGVVTRVLVDKGVLTAQVDDGTGEPKFVPVNSITDIRETGTDKHVPKGPKPATPPKAINFKSDGNGGFIETCEEGKQELGLWTWDETKWEWVYKSFSEESGPGSGEGPGGESNSGSNSGPGAGPLAA